MSLKEARKHKHCSYSKFVLPFDFKHGLHFQVKHLEKKIGSILYKYYSYKILSEIRQFRSWM